MMSLNTEAHVAIGRLIGAYPAFVDMADLPNIEKLFTEDVVFSYGDVTFTGREETLTMLASAPLGIHLAGVPYITVGEDRVTATASVQFLYVRDGSADVVRGTYRDQIRLQDGEWRFSARTIELRPNA